MLWRLENYSYLTNGMFKLFEVQDMLILTVLARQKHQKYFER